ncbi:MAG: ABC transporter ATP-binding protein [Clostridia bacterium]|nr:ABC transporter ATP-binding protein [Clostridia bacterium]
MPPLMHPPIRNGGKKEKLDKASIKKLIVYLKPYTFSIIISIVLAILSSVASIIGPNKISDLISAITSGIYSVSGINMQEFYSVFIFLVCLYAFGAISGYTQQFIMAGITQKTSKRLRTDLNKKLNKLPLKYFDTTTRGDIISRVTNDVDTISQSLGSTIANLVSAITLFVGVLIMMFVVSPILAGVTIGASIIGFLLMGLILSRSQKYFNLRQQNLGELNGQIEEVYSNLGVINAYNASGFYKEKFNKINGELYKNNWKSQALSGLMPPLMNFAGNLSFALIFVVGVALILGGSNAISFGTIISFTIYARLFAQPLSTISQSFSMLQQTSAASRRVFEVLDEKEMENEDEKTATLSSVSGNIEFKDVVFGYNENKTIIKGFSAKFSAGQKVAIVGPTGAGKTTLVNLLMRFYETNSGDILIDGISIKSMKREQVHSLFDMILQDTWVFDGTIKENLAFNKENVSDEEILNAINAVGLSHFVSTLKNGINTKIDGSLGLSEGQKQQLTIARAIIKNSPLLILDEATSSVDTRTELVIQNAMDKLTFGRTSFVIAHRLSTIKNADVILVLKDGDIVEKGTHEELLNKNGDYAELYNSQFAET